MIFRDTVRLPKKIQEATTEIQGQSLALMLILISLMQQEKQYKVEITLREYLDLLNESETYQNESFVFTACKELDISTVKIDGEKYKVFDYVSYSEGKIHAKVGTKVEEFLNKNNDSLIFGNYGN